MSVFEQATLFVTVIGFAVALFSILAALHYSRRFSQRREMVRSWLMPFFVSPFVVWSAKTLTEEDRLYRRKALKAWLSAATALILSLIVLVLGIEVPKI